MSSRARSGNLGEQEKTSKFLGKCFESYPGSTVIERGLLLRIFPADIEGGAAALPALFEEEGFQRDVKVPTCQNCGD